MSEKTTQNTENTSPQNAVADLASTGSAVANQGQEGADQAQELPENTQQTNDQVTTAGEQSPAAIPSDIIQIVNTEEGDYTFSKNGYAIDKGNIRSIDKIKNFLLDLSKNFKKKFPESNEEFQALIKSKSKLNVGKDVDPHNENFFMPLKVDPSHKVGDWVPVIFNEEAPSFQSLNSKQKDKLIKRHKFAYKGYFDRRKIKFSNVDINNKKSILNDKVLEASKLKWAAKGIINYKTGNLSIIPGAKRRAAKRFNNEYGVDEDGNDIAGNNLAEETNSTLTQNNETNQESQDNSEKITLPGLDEYDENIRESVDLAVNFIKKVIRLIPKGKVSMPFFKLTDKGILIDVRVSVESEIIGKTIMTSSFNIEFGKTFNLNYIGSEITGIPEIDINLLDGKFIFQTSVDNLVSDIREDNHTFKASNPTIKNKINGNEITLRANDLIYHTKSKTFSGNGITGSLNVNFFGYNFNGQIKDLDFVDNKPTIGLGIGKINELNFTSHFKAENIAATYILLENGDQQLVADTTIKMTNIGPKGVNVSNLNGRLISNIDLSNISSSPIDVKDGVLQGEFLGNKININGFEYANNTKTFSAEKGNLEYSLFNHSGNIEIKNPTYEESNGFDFSEIKATIKEEISLLNLFKFKDITLKATHENGVYGFGFNSIVSSDKIIDFKMFGEGVTINDASGVVNYDSGAQKKLTFNDGKISGNVAFGDGILDFNLGGIENTEKSFSIENLTGKFSYPSLNINDITITGKNITFSGSGNGSEMTYESIKTSGFQLPKDFGFMSASLNEVEVKNNSNNKEVLVGFTGNLKDLFPEMEDQQGDGSLSANVSGLVGYNYKDDKKIFKLTELEASGTIVNPLNRLNELIGEFKSGRIDVGMSIPVFPLVYAEFGMFLEAAMNLGGSPITLNASLSDNVVNLSMDSFEIGSGHIAAGVYAGIQAGSKFLVSLALFLNAYGKAKAKLEVKYDSTLNFNSETGLPNITPKANTFHGFDYELSADMDLEADLKAVATAFLIFKKSFTYNIGKKSLGTLTYSSDKKNKQEGPGESLVTDEADFKSKGNVSNKYARKSIKELIQINPKERFDNTEKGVIAEKFKNNNGNAEKDKEFNEGIDHTLHITEKNHLIKVRELSSKLIKLDQITNFQNNRFDWNVIVQSVESINSGLSAVKLEYHNNTKRNLIGSEIFNYTKFGKVVKGEIIDDEYQEKLSKSINYIKDLDQVSQNFNTTKTFNNTHRGIFKAFKILNINTFENDSGFVESILNKRNNIIKSQEKQINNLISINSFKGTNLHSKSKSDLDQILSKKPLSEGKLNGMEDDLLSPLKDYRKKMSIHEMEINFLRKEIIFQEREINSGYYASKLASLSES